MLFCKGIIDSRDTSLFWAVAYLSNVDVFAGFGTSQAADKNVEQIAAQQQMAPEGTTCIGSRFCNAPKGVGT